MKLYTKKGDDGSTGLAGGGRVSKADSRVAAYGEVDELNAAIGVVVAGCDDAETAETLEGLQADLFTVGAELATSSDQKPRTTVGHEHIARLEELIDAATAEVPPLTCFILPGGTRTAAALHLARTVCRRAERSSVALAGQQSVRGDVLVYLNRLSDLLFALARRANHRGKTPETPWSARGGET